MIQKTFAAVGVLAVLALLGRGLEDVRPISTEVGILPRTHGSSLFTRGQTQALGVITLGTASDEQRVEELCRSVQQTSAQRGSSRKSRSA